MSLPSGEATWEVEGAGEDGMEWLSELISRRATELWSAHP